MRFTILILFFLIFSCKTEPILRIPSKAVVEQSYFCQSPDSKYIIKAYRFKDFDNINLDAFEEYLDCQGSTDNTTSYLELTKISELKDEDFFVLKTLLENKLICKMDSFIPKEHENLSVSGCKRQFSKSVNGQYFDYTVIYFVDYVEYIIYELTNP